MKTSQRKLISVAISLALAAGSAHAVLERVGPLNNAPSVGGYPGWYQDTTGLALEFCDPQNAAEVTGGWCLLLGGDVPNPPEEFPIRFFDEHFYYAASANLAPASGGTALLVLAVEAAFAAGVAPGGQITFSRIRVKLVNAPKTGTYRFIHPYGEELIDAVAGATVQGASIFFTDDVGINCPPGTFDCALNSRLGPFLLPSPVPGGSEIAAIAGPVAGKSYIADPARLGPVTGSSLPDFIDSQGKPRNHNIFRIEGPAGSGLSIDPTTLVRVDWVETTEFSLVGRVFTGTLASRIDVERATYASDSTGTKLDVFASAFPTSPPRMPGARRPPMVAPQLSFFAAPCGGTPDKLGTLHPPFSAPSGVAEVQMFASGGKHWGQIQPATLPPAVCVKDGSARDQKGNLVPAFVPQPVADDVLISTALFDPSAGTLSVVATSSDASSTPPMLSLAYDNFRADLVAGQIAVTGLFAPPSRVRVLSSRFGQGESLVRTGIGSTPSAGPVALNDSFTFAEDSGTQNLAVLGNDSNVAGAPAPVLVSLTQPQLGIAVAKADGTVDYTPNLNANGVDAFTYTVTVNGQASNTANVTLNITPVNDAPTDVNDSASAIANVPLAINVLANDSDPDGAADLVAAVIVTPPVGATITVAGGVVNFTANAAGPYSFTYRAQDRSGATSAIANVNVTVQAAATETLSITRAEYVLNKLRLRVQGSIAPVANQTTIKLEFANASGTVLGLAGTAVPNAAGTWALDNAEALPAGATRIKATSSTGTVRFLGLTIK